MALDRICPAYIKEKTIRELMSDYNCTYRKALLAYVPRDEISSTNKISKSVSVRLDHDITKIIPVQSLPNSPSYAEIVKTKAVIENPPNSYRKSPTFPIKKNTHLRKREIKRQQAKHTDPWTQCSLPEYNSEDEVNGDNKKPKKEKQREREVSFNELLSKIKAIIFFKNCSLQIKVKQIISVLVEWLIIVVVDKLSDWPMLRGIVESLTGFNGS